MAISSIDDEWLTSHLSKVMVVEFRSASDESFQQSEFEQLAAKFPAVKFCRFDREASFKKWSIKDRPTFVFYVDKEERTRLIRPSIQQVETEIEELSQERPQEPPLKKVKRSKEDAIARGPGDLDSVLMMPPPAGDPNISAGFSFFKEAPRRKSSSPRKRRSSGGSSKESRSSEGSSKSRSDSGDSRQYRTKSSSSSPSGSKSVESLSLSAMRTELVGRFLGLDINQLLMREKHRVSDLISLSNDKLDDLFQKVYYGISPHIELGEFPHDLVKEKPKVDFVATIVTTVLRHVRTKFGLSEEQLFLQDETKFFLKVNDVKKKVRADFVVRGEKCYLAVIECKKANCGWGIKQCLVYLLRLYHLNNNGKPIYGICSNGTHFNLLKYEPNEKPNLIDHLMLLESYRFLFAEMYKSEFEKEWKENYTTFIRILYSILLEKLA